MYNSGKECNVIHSPHVVKSRMTVLEEKKGGRSPATGGGSSNRPAPGRPLVGEGQRQEANEEETTRLRSQRIFY